MSEASGSHCVSILTRPEGRVLRKGTKRGCSKCGKFQSSPSPKAECYTAGASGLGYARRTFQSSPGPKAECYLPRGEASKLDSAWFQSSPGPKAECYRVTWSGGTREHCFNPHPARRPSATFSKRTFGNRLDQFQSSPGPKAECYVVNIVFVIAFFWRVSILTRPEGRVLQTCSST